MQHNSIALLKISHRVMCCLVALLLIFSLVSMPVKVNAAYEMKKEIPIGVYGGVTVNVTAGEAVAGLLLATCFVGVAANWDNFVAQCKSIYANVSSSVRSWFDSVGSKIGVDTEYVTIVIPPNVVKEFNEKNGQDKKLPENIPFVGPLSYPMFTQLDTANEDTVFSPDVATLIAKGVSLLDALTLSLDAFRQDSYFQYRVMHDAFYSQIVETRLALNNTLIDSFHDLYQRVSILSNQMESQFIETRQSLINKIDSVSSAIYDNISLVRNQIVAQLISVGGDIRTLNNTIVDAFNSLTKNIGTILTNTSNVIVNKIDVVSSSIYDNISLARKQIVEQLVQTRNNVLTELDSINARIDSVVDDLAKLRTDVLSRLDGITAGIDSLAGQISTGIKDGLADVEIGTDTEVALPSTLPGISAITGTLSDVIPGFKDFFNDPGDDDRRYPTGLPWLPKFMNGENNYFWQMLNDSAFMSAIQSFFNFVAALWLLFPLAVRYLIIFGFGAPLFVSTAKMLVG